MPAAIPSIIFSCWRSRNFGATGACEPHNNWSSDPCLNSSKQSQAKSAECVGYNRFDWGKPHINSVTMQGDDGFMQYPYTRSRLLCCSDRITSNSCRKASITFGSSIIVKNFAATFIPFHCARKTAPLVPFAIKLSLATSEISSIRPDLIRARAICPAPGSAWFSVSTLARLALLTSAGVLWRRCLFD